METLPTTIPSIHDVLAMNNKGAHCLAIGDNQHAMEQFLRALSAIQRVTQYFGDHVKFFNPGADSTDQQVFVKGAHQFPSLRSQSFFVYGEALFLLPEQSSTDISSDRLPLISAAVLFNLALTFHDEGMSTSESGLDRALDLYRMCLELLESESEDCLSTRALAILAANNKCHIHYERSQFVEASRCLEAVSELMQGQEDLGAALSVEDVTGLVLNLMLVNPPSAARAA